MVFKPAFNTSAGMLFGPAALPFLTALSPYRFPVWWTCCILWGGVPQLVVCLAYWVMLVYSEALQSVRLRCSSSPISVFTSLLFTGLSGLQNFPDNFFVVLYKSFMFPFLAVSSASDARLLM